jgi:fatty-acid desaturase
MMSKRLSAEDTAGRTNRVDSRGSHGGAVIVNDTARWEIHPWKQPFWKPAPGKGAVLLYLVLIHIIAVVGLFRYPFPGLRIAALTLLFIALGGFGTTIGYHRMLAHRTLKVSKVVEHFLIFLAMFNGSGAPTSWVGYHRLHHARTDMPEDISSPKQGGFWWAHLRWLYQALAADCRHWCPELTRRQYRIWAYLEVPVLLISLSWGFAFGWKGFFWLGAVRLVYSLHMQCFVNSVSHMGHSEGGNSSKNVWWLGPLQLTAWGENWHRNHHANPGSARFGVRWWQPDFGWYAICAMEAIGLAHGVKRPRKHRQNISSFTTFRHRSAG